MPKGVYERKSNGKGGIPWTAAQHKKYSETMNRKRKEKSNGTVATLSESSASATHIAYAFGKVESFLEHYADGAGISRAALTGGVVDLLRRKTRGQVLGA